MDAHIFDGSQETDSGKLRPPFDVRVLKYSRTLIASVALLGLLATIGVASEVVIAYEFGEIAKVFLDKLSLSSISGRVLIIALSSLSLALSMALASLVARVEARKVKGNLRRSIVAALSIVNPSRGGSFDAIEGGGATVDSEMVQRSKLVTLSTIGSDQIGLYVSDYLPAMVSAVVVPGVLFIYIALRDLTSLLIEVATFISIPPLMVIFGRVAERRSQIKWNSMLRLSQQFSDFVGAMMTFKGLRAEDRAEEMIDGASRRLLQDTMSTLYLAFISGAVLEIISTVAIALVAVVIGVRLTHGDLDVAVAITVLLLAPRPYMAIRSASALFHTNVDAAVALDDLPILDSSEGSTPTSTSAAQAIEADSVVTFYQRYLAPVSFSLSRGDVQFIVGSSGIGKSSLVRSIVGLDNVKSGRVLVDGRSISSLDSRTFASIFSYLPQKSTRLKGSVMDNVLLSNYRITSSEISFDDELIRSVLFVTALTDGSGEPQFDLHAPIDDLGMAISAGQLRRVVLARTLLNGGPILVLDEPTANLDPNLAATVMEGLRTFAKEKILIIVTHDESLIRDGDQVLRIDGARFDGEIGDSPFPREDNGVEARFFDDKRGGL